MCPKPTPVLVPNTYAYESEPMVKPTGFREYDARWLFGSEINLMGVEALGLGLGTLIHELGVKPQLVTGHDFRSYSASIKMALVNGLLAAGIEVKDIGLALDSAQEQGVPLPLTSLTRQMFQAAISEGYGELDMCSTIQVLEHWAGVEVKGK